MYVAMQNNNNYDFDTSSEEEELSSAAFTSNPVALVTEDKRTDT